jgi:3-hydroxyacyl-CoA dehydrogenase/3a,7a,12a-trihydroxy-5b-cholest-24-enoyl-CoA hydratase
MTLDPTHLVGYQFAPTEFVYGERDVSLYALSVGAAADPADASERRFVYELNGAGFVALPTFAVTFPFVVLRQLAEVPGFTFNPMMMLHGEQYLVLQRPLPLAATITNHAHISAVYDKGKGIVVIIDIHGVDDRGAEVAFNQTSVYVRGLGGFGGERGPSGSVNLPPPRPPDAVTRETTQPNQALLYRLSSGDRNPLHVDPQMAALGGYERPILHGLCTFGFAGRAVLKQFGANDPARFRAMKARFSKHVFPGETLITEMWREAETQVIFQCKVAERDEIVISQAAVDLHPAAHAA